MAPNTIPPRWLHTASHCWRTRCALTMADSTSRDRAVGLWVLATMLAIAAIAAAGRRWRLARAEGFTVRSVIWLLALLGFVSLTWRTARAASLAARGAGPPRP